MTQADDAKSLQRELFVSAGCRDMIHQETGTLESESQPLAGRTASHRRSTIPTQRHKPARL